MARRRDRSRTTGVNDSAEVHTSGPELSWHRQLLAIKDTLIIVCTPIFLLPIFIVSTSRATRCAYSVLIIAVFWITQCLPMAVTALLPVVLMPWLGVIDSKELCKNYLKDANFLFLGGLLISVAVERWGLHKRVALRVLMLVGSRPVGISLGFTVVTGFLSMWLPNIPTTAMMIPIAVAVLEELDAHRKHARELSSQGKHSGAEMGELPNGHVPKSSDAESIALMDVKANQPAGISQIEEGGPPLNKQELEEDKDFRNFSCMLKLSVMYASNVGGIGTIIGCGPNVVFKGQLESIYGPNTGLNFFSFLIFAFPLVLLMLPLSWLSLTLVFIGPKKAFCNKEPEDKSEYSANAVIRRSFEKLGPMTWCEAWIAALFLTLATLWITKDPQFVPGWGTALPHRFVTDSSTAVSVAIFLFIIPSVRPNYLCFRRKTDPRSPGPAPAILDWPTVHKNMQWDVLLLLGGGFAIADACKASDLSSVIASFLSICSVLPPFVIVIIVSVVSVVCTTFTANVASATILLPIGAELANGAGIHPLYIMLPICVAVSFSHILPVSSPSNAIAFKYGGITMADMMKVGFINCAVHIILLQLAINTWGKAIFNLGEYPSWAPAYSSRTLANATALNGTFTSYISRDWSLTTTAAFRV